MGSHEPEYLYGDIRFLRADRQPCPICGHPTGDCATTTEPPDHVAATDTFPSLGHVEMHIVEEDVHEERRISPFTVARILVVRKGQAITVERARELGLR